MTLPPLASLIQTRLEAGPLPAAEFMALALYHPEWGYYRRRNGPWGFEGKDYYTALDIGPLLGMTLARRLESAWERMDRPARFVAMEPGAGRGWLGRDLLLAASGPFAQALVYVHQDDGPRAEAESALAPFIQEGRARMIAQDEEPEPFTGAVFSNELFDALPAQPWRWNGEAWEREVLTGEGPDWIPGDPGEAAQWFASQAEGGLEPGDGAPWSEGLAPLVKRLSRPLERGLFLTIDYGEAAPRLLAKGADLRRYKGHAVDGRWWEEPGSSDLTADLDFTRLDSLLEGQGFREGATATLSHWVRKHAPLAQWEAQWQELEVRDRVRRMENLLQLTLPGMLGERFRVHEAWKDPRE